MKEPEQSLVHEHARDSDETKAKCNFGFGKLGFEQHLEAFLFQDGVIPGRITDFRRAISRSMSAAGSAWS
jgi:hypothetical protein